MDNLTKEQRRKNMQNIRSVDTEPELKLRLELWKRGFRYRKNAKDVFGKPDICFKSKKVAIFCDSDFWHGRFFRNGIHKPKTNKDYWREKLTKNIKRDQSVNKRLKKEGWTVLRFWESEIRQDVGKCARKIESKIRK